MELEKIIPEGIMAILPVYIPMKGNYSCILTYKGERHELDKTVKVVLASLCKSYFLDLKSVREYYGNILNIKNLIPIPLDKENIFIPLKVRRPLCRNDGSIGYVNLNYIDKVDDNEEKTIIRLKNQSTIECLNTMETVNKHIKNGNIIRRLIDEKPSPLKREDGYLIREYDRPATKGDIYLVINEILRIREAMK